MSSRPRRIHEKKAIPDLAATTGSACTEPKTELRCAKKLGALLSPMNLRKLTASMKIAFRALRINQMRSALTMLGIIIGVAAVIAMVAVGSGAQARIQEQIASIGSNLIIVLSGSITSSGIRMGTGNAQTLTEDDARAIVRECDGAALATPAVRGGAQIVYGNNNWGTQIMGTTPDYLPIRDIGFKRSAVHQLRRRSRRGSRPARQDRRSTICSTARTRWASRPH